MPEEAEEVTQNLGFRVRGLQGLAFSLKPCSEKGCKSEVAIRAARSCFSRNQGYDSAFRVYGSGFRVQDSCLHAGWEVGRCMLKAWEILAIRDWAV